ncbi:cytidylate kinase-like family protein [Dehalococcoidia bacterium]|nr:cytidylate kinase-like family protein [Dehalococcoidia bacterium]
MAIVTLTGRVGAPNHQLGLEVAHLLNADYVDHQILAEASRRAGTSLEAVAVRDERALKGRERLALFFQNFLEKSATAGSGGDPFLGPTGVEVLLSRSMAEVAKAPSTQAQELDDQRYVDIITGVVKDLAKAGNVVIIGRGSHVILKDSPGSLHVYVVSSTESRTQYLMEHDGISEESASKYIKDNDPSRQQFYKKLFKVNAEDPTLYHLFLNLDKLGMEHSARVVAEAAHEMERQLDSS